MVSKVFFTDQAWKRYMLVLIHCTVHYLVWLNCGLVSAHFSKKIFDWNLCLWFNKSGLLKVDNSLNLFQHMCPFCYVFHTFLTLLRDLILKCILGAFQLKFRRWGLLFWHCKSLADYCCRLWKTEHFYSNVSIKFWTNCWIIVSVTLIYFCSLEVSTETHLCFGVCGSLGFLIPVKFLDKHHLHLSFLLFIPFVINLNGYSCDRNASWFQDISSSGCKEGLVISFVLMWDPTMGKNQDSMNYFKFDAFIY